jgi:pantoate--beta-alanine ligase
MNVARTIRQTREAVAGARRAGRSVGLVPTMGALHEGHLSLIRAARDECGFTVVSIFVNPTQFAPGEDLDRYPRTPDADLDACRSLGVDLVFMPSVEEMYGPSGGRGATTVTVEGLPDTLCGRSRPGHFAGVCTVVAKLFNIVLPDKAYFGRKDYQQAAIIRRMVADLDLPVEVVVCPTVREADGLAMSSRNAYLTPAERRQAPALHAALELAREMIASSRPPAAEVVEAVRRHLAGNAPDGEIDYVQVVNPDDLSDVESTEQAVVVALAVRLGRARLIDNMRVDAACGEA